MSAFGPKRTCRKKQSMSLLGVKQTCRLHCKMSANDPKRTSPDKCPLSVERRHWDYLHSGQAEANDMRNGVLLRILRFMYSSLANTAIFGPVSNSKGAVEC